MKKLLLIEDSKLFAKAISKALAGNNFFEVHHASSLAEMNELLEDHDYFVAIADLVLPDAANGEAVYKLIANAIPVVALTGSFDSTLQEQISALPIVDYVIKERKSDIAYAVRLAEILLYTRNMKVLLINSSDTQLTRIMDHLYPFCFDLLPAKSIAAAESVLEQHPDIALVICDFELSDGTGLELVHSVRKKQDELALPILFTLEDLGPTIDAKLLKSGVNDFVTKPFSREELSSRLVTQISSRMRYKQVQHYAATMDQYIIASSTDEYGLIRSVSQAFCDISGYSRAELIGRSHNIVRHPEMKNAVYKEMWQTIRAGQSWQGELKNRKKDGSFYWVEVHIDPLFDAAGAITGYTAIRQDITDKKYIEELSVTDPMTQLYNRRHFNRAFSDIAAQAQQAGQVLAFLIFDVDHFKAYNDNYGHQSGDDVLIQIGQALKQFAQKLSGLGYRLGGEEFALLYQTQDADQAVTAAEQLREKLETLAIEHRFNSASDYVTASFGLYIQTKAADIATTYKEGDLLLYQAKESGRNCVKYASAAL